MIYILESLVIHTKDAIVSNHYSTLNNLIVKRWKQKGSKILTIAYPNLEDEQRISRLCNTLRVFVGMFHRIDWRYWWNRTSFCNQDTFSFSSVGLLV